MGKVRVTITKLDNGIYQGESYYNRETGLASIGGGFTLYSRMTEDGKIIGFIQHTWRGRQSLIDDKGNLIQPTKTEKLHYNAHIKALHEFLHPESVEHPVYTKFIVLEANRANPEIVEARRVKNSLEIKGKYCTYTIRSGQWIEATEYKIKFYNKYMELKEELNKMKKSLFAEEGE